MGSLCDEVSYDWRTSNDKCEERKIKTNDAKFILMGMKLHKWGFLQIAYKVYLIIRSVICNVRDI